MRPATIGLVFALLLGACGQAPRQDQESTLRTGPWRLVLDLKGQELPVQFEVVKDSSAFRLVIHNGEERIEVRDVHVRGDSVRIRMPLFDSEFMALRQGDSVLTGHWVNYLKGPDYRIPFTAKTDASPRFASTGGLDQKDISGHWEAHFSEGTEDAYSAIGIFEQHGGSLTGTFGTETGDYRFLEGVVDGDSLKLSAFDGSHAFLFTAALRNDSLIGRYWSGIHWTEPWIAVRNPGFQLRNPDSLTFLKEGHEMIDFELPTIDGGKASPAGPRNQGRPLLVQVMGSWCPNCVDETVLLNELYTKYNDRGLEVMAIAFEKYEEEEKALRALRRFRDELGVRYPIAYAGQASKENTAEKLPFLDHLMSYPTCILIDRSGRVRRIRTGFYGPGTGEHYQHFKRSLEDFILQLLEEPVAQAG
jgi:thiol-disulfide isomerase/thioredoxin